MNQPRPVLTLKRPRRELKRPTAAANAPVTGKAAAMAKAAAKAASAKLAASPKKVVEVPAFRAVTDERFLAELQSVAPQLWNPDAPLPLAIGIHKQLYPIAERMQVSRRFLRRFLSRWTATASYQHAMGEPGARRFNLDGTPAGEVSETHSDRARERVATEH